MALEIQQLKSLAITYNEAHMKKFQYKYESMYRLISSEAKLTPRFAIYIQLFLLSISSHHFPQSQPQINVFNIALDKSIRICSTNCVLYISTVFLKIDWLMVEIEFNEGNGEEEMDKNI